MQFRCVCVCVCVCVCARARVFACCRTHPGNEQAKTVTLNDSKSSDVTGIRSMSGSLKGAGTKAPLCPFVLRKGKIQ